jgi:Mrp family chromosome partitioning ATPase
MDILLSGMIPPNPLELLSSMHFKDTLSQLAQEYEQIVIDTPPVHLSSDALVLSTYADALVYVIKADSMPRRIAYADIKRLRQANAPLLGVVLNQFGAGKFSKYKEMLYQYFFGRNYLG